MIRQAILDEYEKLKEQETLIRKKKKELSMRFTDYAKFGPNDLVRYPDDAGVYIVQNIVEANLNREDILYLVVDISWLRAPFYEWESNLVKV